GQVARTTGLSVWMGMISILAGVVMVVAGLMRYRKTRTQLDEGKFEPAGFIVDLVTILTVLFGLALAGYGLRGEEFGLVRHRGQSRQGNLWPTTWKKKR